MTELKPCPICGAPAHIDEQEYHEKFEPAYAIECGADYGDMDFIHTCDTEFFDNLDDAIKAWNTRWHPQATRKVVGKTTKHYTCSACAGAIDLADKFCRHCGAEVIDDM